MCERSSNRTKSGLNWNHSSDPAETPCGYNAWSNLDIACTAKESPCTDFSLHWDTLAKYPQNLIAGKVRLVGTRLWRSIVAWGWKYVSGRLPEASWLSLRAGLTWCIISLKLIKSLQFLFRMYSFNNAAFTGHLVIQTRSPLVHNDVMMQWCFVSII